MKSIPLTKGFVALVDDADYAMLSEYDWHFTSGYAYRNYYKPDGRRSRSSMHRMIMGFPFGLKVDHIDGNGLNNQKANLRICTTAENARNSGKRSNGKSSRFKGVCLHKSTGKFQAAIGVNYKKIYLGIYDSEETAFEAYKIASVKYHGSFSNTSIDTLRTTKQEQEYEKE